MSTISSIYSNVNSAARRVVSSIIAAPLLSGATIALTTISVFAVFYTARRRTTSGKRIAVIQSIGTANPVGTTGYNSFLEIVSFILIYVSEEGK